MAINCRLKSIYYKNYEHGYGNSDCRYIKLGNLYQEIQHYDAAKHCYLEAISVSSDNPADNEQCQHLLSVISSITGRHQDALKHEQQGYKILKTLLGPDSVPAKQALTWVKKFTQNVVVSIKMIQGKQEQKIREKALNDLLTSDVPTKQKKNKKNSRMKKKKK